MPSLATRTPTFLSRPTDSLFLWDWATPPEWQTALRAVAPAGERLSDFRIVWESGEPQNPIQRWVIWQMRPVSYTAHQVRREIDPRFTGLTERHPREHAYWHEHSRCYRKWGGGLAKTDRLTWELYHRTGQYGQRWWVIQGPTGGHRYHLTSVEQKLLGVRSKGRMKDVPLAGDLPYAPFDQRVLAHMRQLASVAKWHRVCQYADANEARLDVEEQREAEEARGALADWLDEQFSATFDEYRPIYKQAFREMPNRMSLIPKEDRPRLHDNAEFREQFVNEGT